MKINKVNFPTSQYIQEVTQKRQIVLHHTVSGEGITGDVNWWMHTPERVATSFIIDRQGTIHQLFDDKFWAYHLGLEQKWFTLAKVPYKKLDPLSIGIELDSWGALTPHTNGEFYPVKWDGKKIVPNLKAKPVKYFYEYCTQSKFRNFQYFERYTTLQLSSLRDLLQHLCQKHNIPKQYNDDMWTLSSNALSCKQGIFAHASYRKDKSDVHPQPELINLLKSL